MAVYGDHEAITRFEADENSLFVVIDHVVNFPVATRLWWASEPDIP